NRGPGAKLDKCVTWDGYRVIKTAEEANNFTVANFISGSTWLPSTGIPFKGGLGEVGVIQEAIKLHEPAWE
ncbi:hypothetical protein KI387_002108, partial [Taxus chinensis]